MKWLKEKYESIFYRLYKYFLDVYPKNDDVVRYPIMILSIPIALIYAYIVNNYFTNLSRGIAVLLGLPLILVQFCYFSDKRIEEIAKRYDKSDE